MRKTLKVNIQLEVPWHSYGAKGDKKAEAHIRRWIRDVLRNELSFIPLYVEKDDTGASIEDVTGQIKSRVL